MMTRFFVPVVAGLSLVAGLTLQAGPAAASDPGVDALLAASTTTSITLKWNNQDAGTVAYSGVIIRREPGKTAPATENDGSSVPVTGTNTTKYDDKNLDKSSAYSYSVFEKYANGSVSSAHKITAHTLSDPIMHFAVKSKTPTSATLTWKNPSGVGFGWSWLVRDNGTTPPTLTNHSYDNEVTIGKISNTKSSYTDIGLNVGQKYSYAIFAENPDGMTAPATVETSAADIHWGQTPSAPGGTDQISCATSTMCAVAGGGVSSATWTHGAWSAFQQWDSPGGAAGILASVACSSDVFCISTDDFGNASIWSGRSWSTSTHQDPDPGNGFGPISCVKNENYCIALDSDGRIAIFNNGDWSAEYIDVTPGDSQVSISCVTKTFCVALDTTGMVRTFNGTHWYNHQTSVTDATAVSCSSTTFCMVVGKSGDSSDFDGHNWKSQGGPAPDGNATVTGLSCVSRSFCLAILSNGTDAVYEGIPPEGGGGFGGGTYGDVSGWQSTQTISSGLYLHSVSCPTTAFCAVSGSYQGTGHPAKTYFGRP
jgi:hypothetical protein